MGMGLGLCCCAEEICETLDIGDIDLVFDIGTPDGLHYVDINITDTPDFPFPALPFPFFNTCESTIFSPDPRNCRLLTLESSNGNWVFSRPSEAKTDAGDDIDITLTVDGTAIPVDLGTFGVSSCLVHRKPISLTVSGPGIGTVNFEYVETSFDPINGIGSKGFWRADKDKCPIAIGVKSIVTPRMFRHDQKPVFKAIISGVIDALPGSNCDDQNGTFILDELVSPTVTTITDGWVVESQWDFAGEQSLTKNEPCLISLIIKSSDFIGSDSFLATWGCVPHIIGTEFGPLSSHTRAIWDSNCFGNCGEELSFPQLLTIRTSYFDTDWTELVNEITLGGPVGLFCEEDCDLTNAFFNIVE